MHLIAQYGPWAVGVAIVVGAWIWKHDRKQLVAFYDAHTTAKQREIIAQDVAIVRPLAEAAVPYVEQFYADLPGAQRFIRAVDHVVTILAGRGQTVPPALVRAEIQRAYGIAKANGTLAASTPAKPAATPPAAS